MITDALLCATISSLKISIVEEEKEFQFERNRIAVNLLDNSENIYRLHAPELQDLE